MNKKDFKILLGSYGTDLMRWPESLRNVAAPLFVQYPALVEDAAALDALLDSYTLADIRPELLEEVMEAATIPNNDNIPIALRSVWAKIAMLSACAVIGFWCGSASLKNETIYTAKESSMKPMLLGPTKLSEVIL